MSTEGIVSQSPQPHLLGIYLNDHLAGSAGGVALARRLASKHREMDPGDELQSIARQIAEDRDELISIMGALGITRVYYKEGFAMVGERLGRLKLNGRLVHRSPLSSLVELELMTLGVTGKRAGWRTLRELADTDSRLDPGQLDRLLDRAQGQLDSLERMRVRAAAEALGDG